MPLFPDESPREENPTGQHRKPCACCGTARTHEAPAASSPAASSPATTEASPREIGGGWKMVVGHDGEGKPVINVSSSWALSIDQFVTSIGKDKAALLVSQLDEIIAPKEPEKTDAQVESLKAKQARIDELEAEIKAIREHQTERRLLDYRSSDEAKAARDRARQTFAISEKSEESEESASLPDDLCDALQPMLAALSKAMDEGLGETHDVVVEVSKQRTFLQVGRQSVASTTGPRDALVRLLENISSSLRKPAMQEKLLARAEQGHAATVLHLGTLLQKMLDASAEESP